MRNNFNSTVLVIWISFAPRVLWTFCTGRTFFTRDAFPKLYIRVAPWIFLTRYAFPKFYLWIVANNPLCISIGLRSLPKIRLTGCTALLFLFFFWFGFIVWPVLFVIIFGFALCFLTLCWRCFWFGVEGFWRVVFWLWDRRVRTTTFVLLGFYDRLLVVIVI